MPSQPPHPEQNVPTNLDEEIQSTNTARTPLPQPDFAILCAMRMLDPMTFHQIIPYINDMVSRLDIVKDKSEVGVYSGVVESVFAVSQLLCLLPWGAYADHFGPKRAILSATLGLAASTIWFGFSTSFASIVISRALVGLFAGNAALIPGAVGKITDDSNKNRAFARFGIWWPLGVVLGPVIGGWTSRPVDRFPMFSGLALFELFPYLLPSLIVASYTLVVWLIALANLDLSETGMNTNLKPRATSTPSVHNAVEEDVTHYGTIQLPQHSPSTSFLRELWASIKDMFVQRPKSVIVNGKDLIKIPMVRALCVSGLWLGFVYIAFDAVFTLYCYTPVDEGGLGLPPSQIGIAFMIAGLLAGLLSAFIMDKVLDRVAPERIYWLFSSAWPIPFIFTPFLNFIARRSVVGTWFGIGFILVFVRLGNYPLVLNSRIVRDYAPSPDTLSTLNAMLQFSVSFTRILGPIIGNALFSFSRKYNILGGHLWAVLLFLAGVAASFSSRTVYAESQKRIELAGDEDLM